MKSLIDLGIDVLDGCIHDCFGCQVKKSDGRSITVEEVGKLYHFLTKMQQNPNDKQTFGILAIGPTDFIMSQNSAEVFETMVKLMDLFDVIELSSTMTYKPEILKEKLLPLKPYLNGRKLAIGIPLHPNNYHNQKFHDLVDRNVDAVLDVFDECQIYNLAYQVNVVAYLEGKENPVIGIETSALSGKVKEILITIPDGRADMKDLNNKLALGTSIKALRKLHNEFYQGNDTDPSSMGLLYTEGLLQGYTNMVENGERIRCYDVDMFYYKGRLYKPGFYGEEIIILDEDFSVPFGEGEPEVLGDLESHLLAQQMLVMDDECSSCQFSTVCLSNSNVLIKHKYTGGECPMPKQKMEQFAPVVLSEIAQSHS